MIQNNPPHPGEILDEMYLKPLNKTIFELSAQSGVSCADLNEIIATNLSINKEIAEGLAKALGTTAELWLNMQSSYDNFCEFNPLKQVAEFHRVFKHPILDTPQIPDAKRSELRLNLIHEEYMELEKAIEENDIVAVADAFCDLQYVLSGAILEFGLENKFPTLFNEVHRSNMSKLCSSEAEAMETIAYYKVLDGTEAYFEKEGDKFHVKRLSDNKTLKSIDYSKADLKSLL